MRKSCLLVVFMLLVMIHSSFSFTKCKKHELEALSKFKHSFIRDPRSVFSSWVGEDCCQWHGVGCDNVTSDVIKLSLLNPYGYTKALVSSKPSPTLLELKSLSHLDLSCNNFTGSRIPTFVGSLTKLRYLDFSSAGFSGPIPAQLGNLTNLIHLDLSDNEVYMERLEWASGLSKLQFLDMSLINMSQSYDTLQVLFRLPSLLQLRLIGCLLDKTHLSKLLITNSSTLEYLEVSNNNFEGPLPSFLKNMPFLQTLYLMDNRFSGHFPIWLGNFRRLEYLYLSDNEFQGNVPATTLGKLHALRHVDLSNNRLTGLIQDIFGLSHLTQLKHLDISSNSFHSTVSHIGNFSKLTYLAMNNNNIKFNLSTNWRPPFQLQHFGAHSCGINTAFPKWLRNQTRILTLDLSNTGIFGEFPQWLSNLTNLFELELADNKLTGSLPHNFNGLNLMWLDLQNNKLSGTIPHWLKHLKSLNLLNLSRNLLSGRVFQGENASSLLSAYSVLELLDLSDNKLSGEMQFLQFTNAYLRAHLLVLRLRRNYFSGLISSKLCNFTSLGVLDLAQNRFTGHIPSCLGSLTFGVDGFISTHTKFQEIIKGTSENINGGQLKAHSMVDLSCNRLVGTIPKELTNITNLKQLILSNNHLRGGIPDDIGNIKLLETLDLSNNNLSGTIPQSLSAIPWLSDLNLSYNNLYGPIPTGSQLQTLVDPSIYVGNPGLCGFPLPKCSKPNPPPSPTVGGHEAEKDDGAKDKLDKLWLYLAVMSGVATGFWGVVLTLVFKKSWRHAYFRFVEEVGDRIYVPLKVRINRFKRT